MSKIRVRTQPKPFKRTDIQFNFSDVSRKNPKTETRTPTYLYADDSVPKRNRVSQRWWESERNGERK